MWRATLAWPVKPSEMPRIEIAPVRPSPLATKPGTSVATSLMFSKSACSSRSPVKALTDDAGISCSDSSRLVMVTVIS